MLTPKQREVYALIIKGKTNKQIAQELDIAEGTVKAHVHAILRAMEAKNRLELLARCVP